MFCTSSDEISKNTNSLETNNELYLPPELLERIVSYFDGRSLLCFKSLSKTCNEIASNAIRFNKNLWQKICIKEIPRKYIFDMLNKSLDTFTPLDSLTESQYEALYKQWLQWQSPVLNVSRIGEKHFLGSGDIKKIICYKFDVMIEFSFYKRTFSLIKNDEMSEGYDIKENEPKPNIPLTLVLFNPQYQMRKEGEEVDQFTTCYSTGFNECLIHKPNHHRYIRGLNYRYIGTLIDVDYNIYANMCCWIREKWYEWHSDVGLNTLSTHFCDKLKNTIFTSIVHGVVIGWIPKNCIIIHDIHKDTCRIVRVWLDQYYTEATAIYIYGNILFIGTKNGYLLAYKLKCWGDLIKLKQENLLLKMKLCIGQIKKLAIMDFKNVKAIIVASNASVVWIKVN